MRPGAADRLRRMLCVLAYLADEGSASIEDLAQRFGLTPERMRGELELMSMTGLPPYDFLINLDVYDDEVVANLPDYLHRPLRLSRAEGLAVLTAGRTLAAVPGADQEPLAEALAALAAALGFDDEQVDVVLDEPPFLASVREAQANQETLDITYYARWSDSVDDRTIDALRVALADGDWYVDAYRHDLGTVRKLRVSRIQAVTPTGRHFDHEIELGPPTSFDPPDDAVQVRILLPADAAWAAEVYPGTIAAEHPDDSFELELHVIGTTWLERLMLRAGPEARVLDPPSSSTCRQLPRAACSPGTERWSHLRPTFVPTGRRRPDEEVLGYDG